MDGQALLYRWRTQARCIAGAYGGSRLGTQQTKTPTCDTGPMSSDTKEQQSLFIATGAVLWIATLEYFLAQIIAQWAWSDYDPLRYDVSALGATHCGPFIDPISHVSLGYFCSPLH